MKEKTCPECANHCPVSALQCGKGMAYFGLRGQEPDAAALTAALTGADKAALETLLQKLLVAWKNGA